MGTGQVGVGIVDGNNNNAKRIRAESMGLIVYLYSTVTEAVLVVILVESGGSCSVFD